MRKLLPALFAVSILSGFFVFSPLAVAAPGAVRCGKLLDVRSGQMLSDQVVLFDESGTILSVTSPASAKLPAGLTPIDLSSTTCLPGLIDVHTHLTADPSASGYAGLGISVPREAITGVKNARATLRAGFTTVRNVGAGGFTDVALRDAINDGDVNGPRMRVSGPALGITGGSFTRLVKDVEKLAGYVALDQERRDVREGKWTFSFLGDAMTKRKLSKISQQIRQMGSLIESPRWFYKQDRVWLLAAIRDYALAASVHDDGEWFDTEERPLQLPIVEMFEQGDSDQARIVAEHLEQPLVSMDPMFVLQNMEGNRALYFDFETNTVIYNSIVRGATTSTEQSA